MTNWDEVANKDDIDSIDAKIGTSSDNESKATLFGKLWIIRNVVDWIKTWLTDKLDMKISDVSASIDLTKVNSTIGTPNEITLDKRPSFIKDCYIDNYVALPYLNGSFSTFSISKVGDYIYFLSGSGSFKLSLLTGQCSSISNRNYAGDKAAVCSDETYIYMIKNTNAVKYNTLTDTYETIANCPYDCKYGNAIVVGGYIYIFGGGWGSSAVEAKYAYKYNIQSNSYTQITTSAPYAFSNMTGVKLCKLNDDEIYFVASMAGGEAPFTFDYKYKISTNAWTTLNVKPFSSNYCSVIRYGEFIYYINVERESADGSSVSFKKSIADGVFTKLKNLHPYNDNAISFEHNGRIFSFTSPLNKFIGSYYSDVQSLDFVTNVYLTKYSKVKTNVDITKNGVVLNKVDGIVYIQEDGMYTLSFPPIYFNVM